MFNQHIGRLVYHMLPQQNRLKKTRDIEIVMENGRFFSGHTINLKVWFINPDQFPKRGYTKQDLKFAFVVGKKVHKSAVNRNRLKRQMREVVRLLLKGAKLRPGSMVVVMAKKEMLDATHKDIEKDMNFLLSKAKIIAY